MERIKSIRAGSKTVKVDWGENVTDVDYNNAVAMASVISRGAYIKEEIIEDFAFVVYGNQYVVDYLSGENLDFTIDWGDGTESVVNSAATAQRTHTYATEQEWTITIKNYVKGWIYFSSSAQKDKLRKVLSPFPASLTRTSFASCFYDCGGLLSIPDNLFINNPNAENFEGCFYKCYSLALIPSKLFSNNIKATKFDFCFCETSITSIPEVLFENNINALRFDNCFCKTLITSIPERLFAKCINATRFVGCFYGDTNLASIPENLFANNPNVITFNECFRETGITSIPEKLFINNIDVQGFARCFYMCLKLMSIPENLFINNLNVTSFSACFYYGRNFPNINIKIHSNALAKNTNFSSMFEVEYEEYSHSGIAPDFWNSATTSSSYKSKCFFNCTALTNYSEIPSAWK